MKTITLLLLLFVTIDLRASADLELSERAADFSLALTDQPQASWDWDLIRVRFILQAGVEVPFITDFSINPEVEFYFEKTASGVPLPVAELGP